MGFSDPVVGGTVLRVPAIQSPNYVLGVSGWTIRADGSAQFNNISITGGGVIKVSVQATAPAGAHTGDLWFDTSNGNRLNQYNGTIWVPFQYGTNAIASGAITASLIAANTITAAQIAAGTITATQIAAGTITAAKLAAGLIVAGIVDGTTISGAQFIAHGASGEMLVYSGTPASGNLIASVSATSGADAHGDSFAAGFSVYTGNGASDLFLSVQNAGLLYGLNSDLPTGTGGLFVVGGAEMRIQNVLVATDPVSGGPETWHSLGTLAGYTVNYGRYRLTPRNEVEFDLHVTGGGANAGTGVAFANTLPAAYQPLASGPTRRYPLESGRPVTAGDPWPRAEISTAGVVTIFTAANVANSFSSGFNMPLD